MNELALFAGIGGGILGGKLLGWRTICAVENNPFCIERLMQRQNEGFLDPFPIWDDIQTFDGIPWKGIVDVISGGFPCQDISMARGANAKGLQGKKSGLWSEMARIIREIECRYVFVENSPALTFRGIDIVLRNLAAMGYNAKWGVFSAGDIGARHKRERIWILGDNRDSCSMPARPKRALYGPLKKSLRNSQLGGDVTTARMVRKIDVNADWMDRIGAIGNAQVPAVAAMAFKILSGEFA